jgi:hypothetical protein
MHYQNEDELGASLLERATRFSQETGMAISRIAKEATGDSGFFVGLRAGHGLRIKTYNRVMQWLDAAEQKELENERS